MALIRKIKNYILLFRFRTSVKLLDAKKTKKIEVDTQILTTVILFIPQLSLCLKGQP